MPLDEHVDQPLLILSCRPGQLQDVTVDLEAHGAARCVAGCQPPPDRRHDIADPPCLLAELNDEPAERHHIERSGTWRGLLGCPQRGHILDIELTELVAEEGRQRLEPLGIRPSSDT